MNKLQFAILIAAAGAVLGTIVHPGIQEIGLVTLAAVIIAGIVGAKPTPRTA